MSTLTAVTPRKALANSNHWILDSPALHPAHAGVGDGHADQALVPPPRQHEQGAGRDAGGLRAARRAP